MGSFTTTIEIGSGLADYEAEIEVSYRIHPGDRGSYYQPPEEATAEIEDITILASDGTKFPAPWLADLMAEDEEILALCMLDAEERHQDAAECRAEAKREARMLGEDT